MWSTIVRSHFPLNILLPLPYIVDSSHMDCCVLVAELFDTISLHTPLPLLLDYPRHHPIHRRSTKPLPLSPSDTLADPFVLNRAATVMNVTQTRRIAIETIRIRHCCDPSATVVTMGHMTLSHSAWRLFSCSSFFIDGIVTVRR